MCSAPPLPEIARLIDPGRQGGGQQVRDALSARRHPVHRDPAGIPAERADVGLDPAQRRDLVQKAGLPGVRELGSGQVR